MQGNFAFIDPTGSLSGFVAELRPWLTPEFHGCCYYTLNIASRSVLRQSGARLFPDRTRLPPPASISDDEAMDAVGPRVRLEMGNRAKTLKTARRLYASLSTFFDNTNPSVCLIANCFGMVGSIAAHIARERGIRYVFPENGYLPGTMQLDCEGVNYFASITSAIREGRYDPAPDPGLDVALDRIIANFRSGQTPKPTPSASKTRLSAGARFRRELVRTMSPSKWRFAGSSWQHSFADQLPSNIGPYVFLPLQVVNDSQLVLHSPLVGQDMGLMVRHIDKALRKADPDMRLVVKLHPKEQSRYTKQYFRLSRELKNVYFVRDIPVQELINRATSVVTVNSTTGFEAIALGKPVVTLGRNFYCFEPLVHPVERLEELPEKLRASLDVKPDEALRLKFLRYVYRTILAHGSYRDFSDASLRAVSDRIKQLAGVHQAASSPI